MVRAISYSNTEVRFSDAGKGTCIVLLHGYLESLEIWNCIAEELHEDFRVICPDLPGHGKSGILGVRSFNLLRAVFGNYWRLDYQNPH